MNELTQRGIAALKSGDRASARQLLTTAVRQDPDDAVAWLWLTGALDSDDQRLACLRQVLRIDPTNQAAARGITQILERRMRPAQSKPAQPESSPQITPPPLVEESASTPENQPTATEKVAASPAAVDPEAVVLTPASSETSSDLAGVLPAAVAAPAAAPVSEVPAAVPSARRKAYRPVEDPSARPVFRARPSLVPALICFWLFMFGSAVVASLLSSIPEIGLLLAGALFFILELVVVYAIIRNLGVRYELTNQQLTLRFNGKRARIPIAEIYQAELSQSFLQRLIGIGHIDIDAAVDGQLAHVRIRNLPQARRRIEQIQYLVRDHAST